MDQQNDMNRSDNSILLPTVIVQQAIDRARHLGIDLSSYIQTLIKDDLSDKAQDAWRRPLPAVVSEQYAADLQEFLAIEINSPQPGADSGQQLADLLDQEMG